MESNSPQKTLPRKSTRRSPLRRPGCVIALILWFTLLLSPCIFIYLAANEEISIQTGDAPEQRLRIWLVQAAGQSGLGISNGTVYQQDDNNLCVQTDVNFLLWRGEGQSSQYCECYTHSQSGWDTTEVNQGTCAQP